MMRHAACAVLLLLLATALSAQQGTADLGGVVRDDHGAVLPDVRITVRNEDTGTSRESRTNAGGTYFVSGLLPGRYEVRAALPGFKQAARPGVVLAVGRTSTLDLTLVVGAIAEAVTVEAATPLLDLTAHEIGGHITSRELIGLPSLNRSFVGFISLLPGIVPIPNDAFGADAVSVNGIDPRNNNFMLDGANNNDDFLGQRAGTQVRTPIEAVQEFQVLTHQFDAEFGRATGAVVNAVTRQGTNAMRGSAFAFFQHDRLASRDVFARQNSLDAPDSEQQQYGGTIGGPVVRNKAHFFGSLEAVRLNRGTTVNVPARPGLTTTATTEGRVWNTIVRFNHQLNASHSWDVRWLRESSPQDNLIVSVGGRQPTLAAARAESDVDQTAVAAVQSVLGNARVNTLRLAFAREDVAFANPGFNGNGRRQDVLPATLQYPTFIDQQSEVAMARVNDAFSIEDALSWFIPGERGSHDLRFGVQYQFATIDSTNQSGLNGIFEFRSSAPFDAANPATYPERLQIRVPGSSDVFLKGHFLSAFAQDKWRAGRRLTLTAGIRYDVDLIPLGEENNPFFTNPGGYPVDPDNLAPRAGVAYTLDAAGRSLVRGGYGVFYDKTHFELIAPVITAGALSDSFVVSFPANGVDPGPSAGRLPSEPLLRRGPTVDMEQIRRLFPRGSRTRNTGTVYFDNPGRRVPRTNQATVGYARQFGSTVMASVDYTHADGRDLFVARDLNPGTRADVSRTAPVTRVNPAFTTSVLQYGHDGRSTYDALQVQLDRRFSRGVGGRVSYTLSSSRGNTSGNGAPQILVQQLDDVRLEANEGPTDFDRRHNLVLSGMLEVPKTGGVTVSAVARALSGLPFSVIDSSTDPDRNGILFDFLPAGRYAGEGANAIAIDYDGGRNGAYGPGLFQLDLRVGFRRRVGRQSTIDVFGEVFNATDHAAYDNPATAVLGHFAADRRLPDFLTLRMLRPGTVPRTGQIGLRLAF